jgi:ribosomal protein S18 acetylase RimI-like enzyme
MLDDSANGQHTLAGDVLYVSSIATHPDLRGTGIAGRLFDWGIADMHMRFDLCADALHVARDNPVAREMYARRGFKRYAFIEGFYEGGGDMTGELMVRTAR